MTTVEILKAARARIADPKCWTTGKYSRDRDGDQADPGGKTAVCWCAEGSVMAECGEYRGGPDVALKELDKTAAQIEGRDGGGYVPAFNDSHTHAEVLNLFDRTIARLENS